MNLTIFLHVTADKQDKQGFYPIKAQLDVNSERLQFTLPKLRAKSEHWCKESQRAKPNTPNGELINTIIERICERYNAAQKKCEEEKLLITSKELQKILLAKEPPKLNFSNMIEKFMLHYKNLCSVGLCSDSTVNLYEYRAKNWRAYFIDKERLNDITQIKKVMQDGLYLYVLGTSAVHNTAVSILVGFKTFLNFCIDNEWIDKNVFMRLKYKMEDKPKVFLTIAEIEAIRSLDLSEKPTLHQAKLQQARDFFLISCATGLGYQELSDLNREQVQTLERDYLFIERQKTKIQAYIPILEEAGILLEKYDYVFSMKYWTYNKFVKEVKSLANITKKVTTHTGRKTFGNIMLNEHNVPLEVVSSMMCHADISTTAKYYTEVSVEKVRQNTAHLK